MQSAVSCSRAGSIFGLAQRARVPACRYMHSSLIWAPLLLSKLALVAPQQSGRACTVRYAKARSGATDVTVEKKRLLYFTAERQLSVVMANP